MREEKYFYTDSYCKVLTARISEMRAAGEAAWLQFDKTIFYPGGGGQLADRGTINDIVVQEVKEEDGHIWHKIANHGSLKPGQEVRLSLDWPWRYYNMQQHSGQHLLSRLMETSDLKTVSVHLGEEYTLIEVEGGFPEEEQLLSLERQANELLREARPLLIHEVSRKDISRFPLRKPAGNWQQIRIVEIKDYDYSACGGTHVQNTAEIGYIKWLDVEKIRGHARIKWLIGQKADDYIRKLFGSMKHIKSELQCEVEQFTERIARLKNDLRNLRKENNVYKRSHLRLRALELYNARDENADFILAEMQREEIPYLSDLAKILVSEYKMAAFLLSDDRFCLVSPEEKYLDTHEFLNDYRETLGLRGGGPPGFVQGVIGNADLQLINGCLKVAAGITK